VGSACDIGAFEVGVCGDGFLDEDEECDDGNSAEGDGCSSVCQVEEPAVEDDAGSTPDLSDLSDPSDEPDISDTAEEDTAAVGSQASGGCSLAIAGTPTSTGMLLLFVFGFLALGLIGTRKRDLV
jgi:cysteine-rich repeat protein